MSRMRMRLALLGALATWQVFAADPTFLRRRVSSIEPKQVDLTTPTAHYRPIFGIGDPDQEQLKGIARYGELTVDPGGSSEMVSYPAEEQIYFIIEGNGVLLYGSEKHPVKGNDFMYLPVGVRHGMANPSTAPVRLLVMGFKIPEGFKVPPTPQLMLASAEDVELRQLSGHGPSSRFKLLLGPTTARPGRDKLAAASMVIEMFLMDFSPGGTNIPHHHDNAEEIYYVLRGHGDMVAGGGADGNEGRHPSQAGDAYFIRLNATVGFYSGAKAGEEHDLVLAVRSKYPFRRERDQ